MPAVHPCPGAPVGVIFLGLVRVTGATRLRGGEVAALGCGEGRETAAEVQTIGGHGRKLHQKYSSAQGRNTKLQFSLRITRCRGVPPGNERSHAASLDRRTSPRSRPPCRGARAAVAPRDSAGRRAAPMPCSAYLASSSSRTARAAGSKLSEEVGMLAAKPAYPVEAAQDRCIPGHVHQDVERVGLGEAGALGQFGERDTPCLQGLDYLLPAYLVVPLRSQVRGAGEEPPHLARHIVAILDQRQPAGRRCRARRSLRATR